MLKWRWLWVFVPLLTGAILGVLFASATFPNPILVLRFDMAALAQICGLGLSLLLAFWFFLDEWSRRMRHEAAQQAEEHSIEDRRRFLQRLDHELKNPLTAIQAGLANLGDDPNALALVSVKAQTQRLSRLVSDLRKLSDLEVRPIERAPINLSEIINNVYEITREKVNTQDRQITRNLPQVPWPLPNVLGDYDLLFLAVHNLVDNALKFSDPGDAIEIRAFEDNATVVIEIADTGQGISEEDLPYIWQELYRGEGARGIPGSGLGLALVKAIIERHNGQVAIRSRLGQGTVVTVRLPVA